MKTQEEPLEAAEQSASGTGPSVEGNRFRGLRVSHEELARHAYALFLGRGAQHGRDKEDWHLAERELLFTR
jgi:hypothetical protein